jgi:outer membrane protein assembly factor BamB
VNVVGDCIAAGEEGCYDGDGEQHRMVGDLLDQSLAFCLQIKKPTKPGKEAFMKHKRFAFFFLAALVLLVSTAAGAYEAFVGPTGVLKWDKSKAYNGFTLFAPQGSRNIYLIDMEGNVVHKWETPYINEEYAELLPNGNLLRGAQVKEEKAVYFGGAGGLLQELSWDNKVVWEYKLNSPKGMFHHGFDRMPNGNTLLNAFEYKSWEEAIAKGRNPKTTYPKGLISHIDPEKRPTMGIWPDFIQEVDQNGKVVWEWHVWDHIGTGPDQFDINFVLPNSPTLGAVYSGPDWSHFNTVQYLPEKDQVLLCSRNFGEIYIVDRKSGKMAWRWGNPGAYGKGKLPGGYADDGDQILFGPHHPQIQANGNITILDNGTLRPSGNRSRVIEIEPTTGKIVWEFGSNGGGRASNSFYASFQGAAQKLPNGNFLVTSTMQGHMFEVTQNKEIVWDYVNPVGRRGPVCVREDYLPAFWVHRSYRYSQHHPGLKGKDLTPKEPLAPGCPVMFRVFEEAKAKK